ncbi:MAG: isoprenylcysteine carboxyl methyltransferase family protein [Rhodomicrobiaceae bacterium]
MSGVDWIDPLALAVLIFVTLQRLAELVYARRNEARLHARGAQEHAPGHYPAIVLLHAAWLVGLWVLAIGTAPDTIWLVIFAVLQALRIWVLLTLGERWTTRIIVLPGEPLVAKGPYRIFSHPNYMVVIGEIFVLPMAFGLFFYAAVFSLLNGLILFIRIRAENKALELADGAPS